MSTIIISPDFDVILDAENKVVGEARSDIAVLDITPLKKKISELEVLVDELASLLGSKAAPVADKRRRKRPRLVALFFTQMAIGFLIGLALLCLCVLTYHAFPHFGAIKSSTGLFKPLT